MIIELMGSPASEVAEATNSTEVPIVEPFVGVLTVTPAKAATLQRSKVISANLNEQIIYSPCRFESPGLLNQALPGLSGT
jgi:hypothetical protein